MNLESGKPGQEYASWKSPEIGRIKPETLSQEQMIAFINSEGGSDTRQYFEVKKVVDKMPVDKLEPLWMGIGQELKDKNIFNSTDEGIDIFQPEGSWVVPYRADLMSQDDLSADFQRRTQISDYDGEGGKVHGYYSGSEAKISATKKEKGELTRSSVTSLAGGTGLGKEADTLIHESFHGFQDIDPMDAQKKTLKMLELQENIKDETEKEKRTGRMSIKPAQYREEYLELQKHLHGEMVSRKVYQDRTIAYEVHSYLFSDPLSFVPTKTGTKEEIRESLYNKVVLTVADICKRYDAEGKDRQATMAFKQIEALRSLGVSNLEIGKVLRDDEYDEENGRYVKLQERIFAEREARHLTREKHLALIDQYETELAYKSVLARKIAMEKLSSAVAGQ